MHGLDGKSICRWTIAACLIACAGCGVFHQHPPGGTYCPPYQDQAVRITATQYLTHISRFTPGAYASGLFAAAARWLSAAAS